jgi:predicted PurR-regulated permease PerM
LRVEIAREQRSFWRLFGSLRRSAQKGIIWGAFLLVLWLLRDFFALIFVTFVFAFVSSSLAKLLGRPFPSLGWKPRVVCVFLGFLLLWTLIGWLFVPQVKAGAVTLTAVVEDFPSRWREKIQPELVREHAWYRWILEQLGVEELAVPAEPVRAWLLEHAPGFITDAVSLVAGTVSLLFLATLFSFLILLDLKTLQAEVQKLEMTKLHHFYRETARNIVKFAEVLGQVLEAQAVIALCNAVLTAVGLYFFGLPQVAFLSLVVFICGFIPVAGVFISSVPICLVGLYHDGVVTGLLLIAFITGIHFVEAYILNPRIMGAALKVNPVLILVVLVIGHHALGVWGLLLGLPLAYYFFSFVIKREEPRVRLFARRRPAAKPPPQRSPLTMPAAHPSEADARFERPPSPPAGAGFTRASSPGIPPGFSAGPPPGPEAGRP